MQAKILNRKIHRWAAIITALPVIIVIITGIILQVKKEFDWIQPHTQHGSVSKPVLGFEQILAVARSVPEAKIETWSDIDRLDVRPGKGMLKVRAENRWELQIDTNTGAVLQVAYRRSDLIESIHDGSFFADIVKLGVFLPSALVLIGLWITGMVLFFQPSLSRAKKRRARAMRFDVLDEGA